MKKYLSLIWNKLLVIVVIAVVFNCQEGSDPIVVKNCRIKQFFTTGTSFSTYNFEYYNHGMVKRIFTNDDYNSFFEYDELKRLVKITIVTDVSTEILRYEYPRPGVIRWQIFDSERERVPEFFIYHTDNKVDSLRITNISSRNPDNTFHSKIVYDGNNVSTILNTIKPCCRDSEISEIQYDNGLNPHTLFRQSTGVFTSYNVLSYVFPQLSPDYLSLNNATEYLEKVTTRASTGPHIIHIHKEFIYTYPSPGTYPSQIVEYQDGGLFGPELNFVYENCD